METLGAFRLLVGPYARVVLSQIDRNIIILYSFMHEKPIGTGVCVIVA